ncbi:MAG: hypothetical protein FJ313_05735 [Gemmatimonadetes bacterium]|nr:hypothetical protein [Gemmatimonadota bacterium]
MTRADLPLEVRVALAVNRRMMQLPGGAVCSCGEARPVCLLRGSEPVICVECARVGWGYGPVEEHHVGGRPSPLPTVLLRSNQHALATWLQEEFWRLDGHEPGSPYAVAFDLGVLAGMGAAWTNVSG